MSFSFIVLASLVPALSACSSGPQSADFGEASDKPVEAAKKAVKRGRVRVVIKGFRNHKGQALVSLFAGPAGFPDNEEFSQKRIARAIDGDSIVVVFDDVEAGSYAVAILHDEDMDFKMATGAFGMPKEGYGVSNNIKGRFGPPKYQDAKFELGAERGVSLSITLIY